MQYQYILRIEGAPRSKIVRALGQPSSTDTGVWAWELKEGTYDPTMPYVDLFLSFIESKSEVLEEIGVSRNDITVWLLYEYDQQCNLEFPASDLKRLGDAGIDLCVSCWQAKP